MIALWLIACGPSESPAAEAGAGSAERHAPESNATRVEVANLSQMEGAELQMSLPGEVRGSQDVILASALGGTVERVSVQKGERVRKGDIIARVDGEIYAAQLDQAEAQHHQATKELERMKRMGDLSSSSQLLQAETQEKVTGAQERIARAQVNRAVVRAPFDGVAADVLPSVGEFLGPGNPVARLVQLDPIKVTLSVADKDVVALRPGLPVMITAAAVAEPLQGVIKNVGQAADLRTRAFTVEVEVANPEGHLLPGMIATVAVEAGLPGDALLIPQDWIVTRRTGQGVFIAADDGFARWAPIELGEVVRDQVLIRAGLERGAKIVITGHRDLADGDKIFIAREGVCCKKGRPVFGEQ